MQSMSMSRACQTQIQRGCNYIRLELKALKNVDGDDSEILRMENGLGFCIELVRWNKRRGEERKKMRWDFQGLLEQGNLAKEIWNIPIQRNNGMILGARQTLCEVARGGSEGA